MRIYVRFCAKCEGMLKIGGILGTKYAEAGSAFITANITEL